MRFPFVFRSSYEIQASFTDHVVRELAKEQQRSASLLETVVNMRLAGGTIQRLAPLPDGQKIEQPKRDPISTAIDENKHAKRSAPLRAYLTRRAASQLDAGASPEQVLEEMKNWSGAPALSQEEDDDLIPLGVG